jgi:mono/diheme cytochrome c family protein
VESRARIISVFLVGLLPVVVLTGCRGTTSEKPPIHIVPNMDYQLRFDPQSRNALFADGRSMRQPVPGTVARGFLRDDTRFYFGRTPDGEFVQDIPATVTREFLLRGRERYEIYCAPCHGRAGDGQGVIMTGQYGYVPAPSYHTDQLRAVPDGYLYDSLTNGVRSMPGYGHLVPVADRWAIVSYVRALQRSQNASASDVPGGVLSEMQQQSRTNIQVGN